MLRFAVLSIAFCLASASVHHERIIGGYEADILDHPYQVAVHFEGELKCSGSLLTLQHIMTAAHCLPEYHVDPETVMLRFGSYSPNMGLDRRPKYWIAHPKFNPPSKNFDVAFFVLKTRYPFFPMETAKPAALITREEHPQHGDILTVAGWGYYSMEEDKTSEYLRAVKLSFLRQELCYKVTEDAPYEYTENMFCAGGAKGKTPYRGDSGGGVINKAKKLVGIVSWGRYVPPVIGYPTIFTDITSPPVRDFIDGVMNGTITKE